MIKAHGETKDGRPLIVIGLSHDNLARLKDGKPISFCLSSMGLAPCEVFVMAGATESAIAKELGVEMPTPAERANAQ